MAGVGWVSQNMELDACQLDGAHLNGFAIGRGHGVEARQGMSVHVNRATGEALPARRWP